ncbi:HEAT repeat domain-containing protein [Desulfurobacterium atlanticum]|uniref:HEAT repeat-containing protein n=1 Tax=Desulfurobacterium atlanticum TaxID=240169 RepID=A0A238YRY6_9BACT|nr:HEAT repeat domain-containing protein [Desulfurobacterium atlanticum]SNR73363.1 HEAT repeat-containing protein [Desulfurobacterium atlanticum]
MRKLIVAFLCFLFSSVSLAANFDINSKNPQDRILAIVYLSRIKDPSNVNKFCEILIKDKNEKVRKTAAEALGYYPFSFRAKSCLLKAFEKDKSNTVKEAVLSALESFNEDDLGKLYCEVLKGKFSDNLKKEALRGLSKYTECKKEIDKILRSGDKKLLKSALFTVSFRQEDFPEVEKYLQSGDSNIRNLAVKYYLTHRPSKKILKNLESRLLIETDPSIKAAVLEVLITNGVLLEKDIVLSVLSNEEVKKAFALRLPFIRNKEISKDIIDSFLQSDDPVVVSAALTYMGRSGDKEYCPILKKFLFKKDESLKKAAIWSMANIGCEDGIDYVLSIISDLNNDDNLRLSAAKNLLIFKPSELSKKKDMIKAVYKNEVLDDIRDVLRLVLQKASNK